MSNPFGDSTTTSADIKGNEDRLGGFRVHDSDIYLATINSAYFVKAASGAKSMNYEVTFEDGTKLTFTEWTHSGTAKGGHNYSEKDGVKSYLPGYVRANSIANMCAGKDLDKLTFETKTIKLRNKDAGTDVPTPVPMAVELLGKQVYLGVLKKVENKTKKVENDGKVEYKRTAETREINEVDKVFHYPKKLTLSEAVEQSEPEFFDKWLKANKGKVVDRVKPAEIESAPGTAGAPGQSAGSDKPTNSLFD